MSKKNNRKTRQKAHNYALQRKWLELNNIYFKCYPSD